MKLPRTTIAVYRQFDDGETFSLEGLATSINEAADLLFHNLIGNEPVSMLAERIDRSETGAFEYHCYETDAVRDAVLQIYEGAEIDSPEINGKQYLSDYSRREQVSWIAEEV